MLKTGNKWVKTSSVLAVFAAAPLIFFGFSDHKESFVPPSFLEARARGSVFAENIVELTGESINNLKLISDEDRAGKYSKGIDLIIGELSRNEITRQNAIGLSNELEIMASVLSEIKPEEAADVGFQAILNQSQTVQRFLNYNNDLYKLLDVLRARFENGGSTGAEEAGSLLYKMNEESKAINELNAKYAELMIEFDSLTATVK